MRSPLLPALVVGSVCVAALTACSSSTDASSTDTSTSPAATSAASSTASPIGGMTTCDVEALTQPAADAVAAESPDMKLDQVDEVQCADGWAAVLADVSGADGAGDGYAITLVFEAEGQFWVPKDRGAVCGTPSTADPSARPDDAQVPAEIWQVGCNSN